MNQTTLAPPILRDHSTLVPSTAVASVASNPTMELKKEGRTGAGGPVSPLPPVVVVVVALFVVRPGHIIVNKKVHSSSQ